MRYFTCILDSMGQGISDTIRQSYEWLPRRRGLQFLWHSFDHAAVLIAWDESHEEPVLAHHGDHFAVGAVRLDNREDVRGWASLQEGGRTDLELILHAVIQGGTKDLPQMIGDFAFVVWSAATRTAVCATDALGVKKLYYAKRNGLLVFASRAEALALDEQYEVQYLAELIALCTLTPGLTAYSGVRTLPAGTIAQLGCDGLASRTYWSPDYFEPTSLRRDAELEAPEACRQLLSDSVRRRVSPNGETWAQLSGGLDSSSIVSTAEWLAEQEAISHRLGGTVTFVDWQHTDADERQYSDAVVARWRVRNETIIDPPFWIDDQATPPYLDQPMESLAFYPRDRRLCAIVRGAGGRVLLAGFGSDELFTGNTLYFADTLARGRIVAAAKEMANWAVVGRVSFWQLAYGNAIRPLLPAVLRSPKSFNQGRLVPWLSPAVTRRYALRDRVHSVAGNGGRIGRKHHHAVVGNVRAITARLDAGALGDRLDVRYPFLYRPLVEFALRLPPKLCVRPHARKWVLREAMRGILPEVVRTRVGKGAPTDVVVRSLTAQRSFLEPLVHDPILAELGVIDRAQLAAALEAAPVATTADRDLCTDVQVTLMVEAWLRIRSGRWPQGPS